MMLGPGLLESPALGDVWELIDSARTVLDLGAVAGQAITMPARNDGDLLIMFAYAPIGTAISGWTVRSTSTPRVWDRISDGTEAPVTAIDGDGNNKQVITVCSFRHSEGLTPTFINVAALQRLNNITGEQEFVLAPLAANGSYDDVLIVCASYRNGRLATSSPSYVGIEPRVSSSINVTAIAVPFFEDFSPDSTHHLFIGGAYANMSSSADAFDEHRFTYTGWPSGVAETSIGSTLRYRGA